MLEVSCLKKRSKMSSKNGVDLMDVSCVFMTDFDD